jgi:hypothetical protein
LELFFRAGMFRGAVLFQSCAEWFAHKFLKTF